MDWEQKNFEFWRCWDKDTTLGSHNLMVTSLKVIQTNKNHQTIFLTYSDISQNYLSQKTDF